MTTQLIYAVDWIDVSSFHKPVLFQKVADLYESGMSLKRVAHELQISKTAARSTLFRGGHAIRPHVGRRKPEEVGAAPYGYARIDGALLKDPKEQRNIQLILNYWKTGMSFTAIAKELNRLSIKPRMAKFWSDTTVRNLVLRFTQDRKLSIERKKS
jgi:hypothetical protein